MNKVRGVLLLMGVLAFSASAFALGDSFVGNGGSAGDLELLIAQKQLQKTFLGNQSVDLENQLCTCEPVFEGRSECSPLADLSEEEVLFCSDQLQQISGQAARLLKQKKISFRWTKEDIFVRQGQKTSTADAVANSVNNTITLNQKRFLSLTDTERLFLLAHEIFHLVPIEKTGEYLSDEGEVGPYLGKQGARRLLNAMAAGTVVESYRNKSLQTFKRTLSRRKSYVENWFDLSWVSLEKASDEGESVYAQESFRGLDLSYTRYFDRVGINIKYSKFNAEKSILSSVNVEEQQSVLGLGFSYRFFPFKDPLTFLGQSFLSLNVNAEILKGKAVVSDAFTGLTVKDSSTGGSAGLKFHLPFRLCWLHVGAGLRKHKLEYKEINLTNDKVQPYVNIGVSHAF